MAASRKAHRNNPRNDLSADFVRSILRYNSKTGLFTWRPRTDPFWWNGKFANKVAGYPDKRGYIKIQIETKKYTASRLAHLIKTRNGPNKEIDHKNRNRADNRWCNLRHSTPTINNQNRTITNSSGLPGAHWHWPTEKWISTISKHRKKMYLGLFDTPQKASDAYRKKARELYKH